MKWLPDLDTRICSLPSQEESDLNRSTTDAGNVAAVSVASEHSERPPGQQATWLDRSVRKPVLAGELWAPWNPSVSTAEDL